MSDVVRRGFLKTVLAGMAVAPMAAAGAKVTKTIKADDVRVKRWKHSGLDFAEWTLPSSVPPHFEEIGQKAQLAMSAGNVSGAGALIQVKRRYVIPVFNRKNTTTPLPELVQRVIQSNQASLPLPVRDSESKKEIPRPELKTFVIVKVEGRPDLMGMGAYSVEVVPVRDFYVGDL